MSEETRIPLDGRVCGFGKEAARVVDPSGLFSDLDRPKSLHL